MKPEPVGPHNAEAHLRLRVILTGGTVDKTFSAATATLTDGVSISRNVLASARLSAMELSFESPFLRDSSALTDGDREELARRILRVPNVADACLVVHGTDTLVESMATLAARMPHVPIPIVFTGAMVPLVVSGTDGTQNLLQAVMACRLLPPGLFVVFHGLALAWPGIEKDKNAGTFRRIRDSD